uniref:Uncharacterized protein n=1 Tax=Babesia bovis TaxID=5865 RepID=S6B400_BABBO|nr:hypothetical protein [Babesia bovis]
MQLSGILHCNDVNLFPVPLQFSPIKLKETDCSCSNGYLMDLYGLICAVCVYIVSEC